MWSSGLSLRYNTSPPPHSPAAKRLQVERQATPTDEQVQALLDRYITELQALYDANKEQYGYANRKLIIM